jgi:predicted O-methyltransferase YrrM
MTHLEYLNSTLAKDLSRDKIFLSVLELFENKPIRIFELGTALDIRFTARYGNGWSSLFWSKYIRENGGSLKTCDVNADAIENCKALLEEFKKDNFVEFLVGDGIKFLKENNEYDLIYLDGSDDPNQMLNQMKVCNLEKSFILCDDFNSKGVVARQEFPNHICFVLSNGHEMGLFGPNIKAETRRIE